MQRIQYIDRIKTYEPVSVDGEPVLKVLDEKDNYSSLAQSKPQVCHQSLI